MLLGTSPIPDRPAPAGYSSKGGIIYTTLDDVFQADKVSGIERWLDRARRFAASYFDGDLKRMSYCLKDVQVVVAFFYSLLIYYVKHFQ